jgi:hypothetical protein
MDNTMSSKGRTPYPTDLTNDEWLEIGELIMRTSTVGRKRTVESREIVNAILYIWHSDCSWRMLPHDFPPWSLVYYYYRRWHQDGTIGHLRYLIGQLRRQPARERLKSMPLRTDEADFSGRHSKGEG